MPSVPMVELRRGAFPESLHVGDAVICSAAGDILQAWGNPDAVVLPRSSCKMIQALPLVESGAADAAGLTSEQLALACASHQAAATHVRLVQGWLETLGLDDSALACGPQEPRDRMARDALIRAGQHPLRLHNNCSGKHAGFLTLARHLRAGGSYVALDHPVQEAVREAFEDVTAAMSPGAATDGCSAPNFATTLRGLARAMAFFATARTGDAALRNRAAARLVDAMVAHPDLVAGEGRACTDLMRAMGGRVAVKTGAEGVFVAILRDRGLGVAVKIHDGAARAAEVAITALLVHLGALEENHPAVARWMRVKQKNFARKDTGWLQPVAGFPT